MAKGIKIASCEEKALKIYVDLAGPKIRTSLKKLKKIGKAYQYFCSNGFNF
jgi:pyruvate kinase